MEWMPFYLQAESGAGKAPPSCRPGAAVRPASAAKNALRPFGISAPLRGAKHRDRRRARRRKTEFGAHGQPAQKRPLTPFRPHFSTIRHFGLEACRHAQKCADYSARPCAPRARAPLYFFPCGSAERLSRPARESDGRRQPSDEKKKPAALCMPNVLSPLPRRGEESSSGNRGFGRRPKRLESAARRARAQARCADQGKQLFF